MSLVNTGKNKLGNKRSNIRKRSYVEWMAVMLALWPFIMRFLLTIPGMPSVIKYVADIAWVYMLATVIFRGEVTFQRRLSPFVCVVVLFFLYTLCTNLFRFQSPLYYIWGFRNNFRFYIAFFSFIVLMKEGDANGLLKLISISFWINFALSLIQFILLGARGDYLGGLFGIAGSSNGYTLLLFSVTIVHTLLLAFKGEYNPRKAFLKCSAALLVAAMAEMKFFFAAFIIMVVLAALLTNLSWKKIGFISISLGIVMIGASLLTNWFDSASFLSLDSLLELATKRNYSSQNDLNRLSAIATLSETIVTRPVDRLFGFGLGNCDTSAYAIFNTPFFRRYSYLNYTWFTAPMIFLETGYIGLIIYLSFFICCFLKSRKMLKSGAGNELFCQMAMIMSILCCIYAFYNSSLRIESAYMIYFVLALPFMKRNENESIGLKSPLPTKEVPT